MLKSIPGNVLCSIAACVVIAGTTAYVATMEATASQPADASKQAQPINPAAPTPVEKLRSESTLLTPLVASDLAKRLLESVELLPSIEPREVYRDRGRGLAISKKEHGKLSDEEQAKFTRKECDEQFYYYTGYGSPLVYTRVVDLAASKFGVDSLANKKVLDFGYGSIGHLRLMALQGADVHGIEVEPLLHTLYSGPADTGVCQNPKTQQSGRITLHHGNWPAEASLVASAGSGYDLITSKNTLKRGYIHPERPADPSRLVHLGVDDDAFLQAVHQSLKPGGLFIIYNISPAQNPPDKEYLPWADGRCPFAREVCTKAGFEVLAFDEDDQSEILRWWSVLGYDQGKPPEQAKAETFAHYTVMRKPK